MKKRTLFTIAAVILLLGLAGFFYGYREYYRTHADSASLKADFSVGVGSMLDEFSRDAVASENKFRNKVVEVTGTIKELDLSDPGAFIIALGDSLSMNAVRCSVDSLHNATVLQAKMGEKAIIKGVYSGYNADELLGTDIILVRCAVKILP